MNKNFSKVVSAEDHQSKSDTKKRKDAEVNQQSFSYNELCTNFKNLNFVDLCKKDSSKCYKDNCFSQPGKNLFLKNCFVSN